MPTYMPGVYYVINAFEHVEGKLLYPSANSESALKDAGWKKLKQGENIVNAKSDVLYRVTFFEEKVAGVQNPAVDKVLTDGSNDIRPSIADAATSAQSGRFFNWHQSKQFKKLASLGKSNIYLSWDGFYVRTIHDRFFDWTIVPKNIAGAIPKPDFKAQVRLQKEYPIFEDYPTNGYTGQYIEVKIKTGDVIPTIIYSKVNTPQSVPENVTDFDSRPQNGPYIWDACNKQYVRYWEKTDIAHLEANPMDTDVKYFVFLRYFDKFGKKIKEVPITNGKVKSEYTLDQWKKTSLMHKAKGIMADIVTASASCGSNAAQTPAPPVVEPKVITATDVLFNPPPHSVTRHFSPIAEGGL
jgi:hypothetical protein